MYHCLYKDITGKVTQTKYTNIYDALIYAEKISQGMDVIKTEGGYLDASIIGHAMSRENLNSLLNQGDVVPYFNFINSQKQRPNTPDLRCVYQDSWLYIFRN